MQVVLFEGRLIQVPSQFNELSARQLRAICRIQLAELPPHQARVWLLLVLCGIGQSVGLCAWFLWHYYLGPLLGKTPLRITVRPLTDEQLYELLELTDWLFAEDFRPLAVQRFRTRWLWWRGWLPVPVRGPSDLLLSCTYRQYRQVEFRLARFPDRPHYIAAALYTPVFSLPFVDSLLDDFARWPPDVLDAIRLHYLGCRQLLHRQHKHLFKRQREADLDDPDYTPPPPPTPQQIEQDYHDIRRALAERLVDEERVDLMPLWDVLGWADYKARQHAELERQLAERHR